MTFKKIFLCLVFIGFLNSCQNGYCPVIDIEIIPFPNSKIGTPERFILSNDIGLEYDLDLETSALFLKNYIESGSNFKLKNSSNKKGIRFVKDAAVSNDEGYELEISGNEIVIKAKTDQGAFYAVQTLRQLLPVTFENGSFNAKQFAIPGLVIEDEPKFKYRGMHLDVGRHMYSVDFIKKYIDALAMLKMNTFHWHLTEDQGWRIEIKKYPKLQEIAAFRDETLKGHYSDQPHQFDGKKYGGYYTQEEIKDIVQYANNRNITIIPEIEMPGHSQAAIAAYPELGCTEVKTQVATKWGVFEEIYCTNDKVFAFLEDVLDEVMDLFPSKYIHIGGDEAPKTRWKNCAACQQKIKANGLKDEHELQNYFITRMEKHLNSKGRNIIGWDEILEGGLAPNATVMSWRGTKGAVEAARQKHHVIMTPTSHCYFDYYQSTNTGEPLAIGGFLPLEKVYNYNPIPNGLTNEESKYVLGAQGNVWTEYMPTSKQVEYMAFPRMLAMSEVLWSKPENKNYTNFVSRLEQFHKRLDVLDINYANHLYEVEGNLWKENGQILYELNTLTADKTIRFTLDGSEPNINSLEYNFSPIIIDTSLTIKAAVFNLEEKLGRIFSEKIYMHKAVGKKIAVNKEPHKAYAGSGAAGLINGISGNNTRFGDKEWLGFWGEDIEITIDLGKEMEVDEIETRFYNGNGQWIYAPIFIEISFNGKDYEEYEIGNSEELLVNFYQSFKDITTKTIKIKVPNYGIIPEGKQGAGNKAWTFIDEIIVN